MSYEGRTVYICEENHIYENGCYDDYFEDENKPMTCQYCGKEMKRIGMVDDTNGEAVAHFWKEEIIPYERLEHSIKDGICTIRYRIPKSMIHYDASKWFNYDTGEEYKDIASESKYEEYKEQLTEDIVR